MKLFQGRERGPSVKEEYEMLLEQMLAIDLQLERAQAGSVVNEKMESDPDWVKRNREVARVQLLDVAGKKEARLQELRKELGIVEDGK